MKRTMAYSVGGQVIPVAADRQQEFLGDVASRGDVADEVKTYRVKKPDGTTQDVPVAMRNIEQFKNDIAANGDSARELVTVNMEDGSEPLTLDREAVVQYARGAAVASPSRQALKQAGIPDWYGKSKEDRARLAAQLGEMFDTEGDKPQVVGTEMNNLGDNISRGVTAVVNSPVGAAVKGFGEGLARSVTDSQELWRETYGDGAIADSLQGANAFAGKLSQKVASLIPAINNITGEVIGLVDKDTGRMFKDEAEAQRYWLANNVDTQDAELVTGMGENVDKAVTKTRDFVGETLSTIGMFAIPGAAPVAIGSDTIDSYYDAYDSALKHGASRDKAEALASAKAAATAAMGVVLGKAARGARSKAGFKGALADMAVTGAEMGALGGVNEAIDEGVEGAESIDVKRIATKVAEEAAGGAAFSAVSRLAHGAANSGQREIEKSAREAKQERDKAIAEEQARIEAQKRYEATLSDEAQNDIDKSVANMVSTGVVPSWRQANEIRERAIAKLAGRGGREAGEDHEQVEFAVIEAAQEVNDELRTPSRVGNEALERRKVEAKARENERWAKRSDELVAEYGKEEAAKRLAEEQAAEARKSADNEAAQQAHDKREDDIKAAFANWKERAVSKQKARKHGKAVKDEKPATPEEQAAAETFEDFARRDPEMLAIDKEWQRASSATDKGDIEFRARARMSELRKEWAKISGEARGASDEAVDASDSTSISTEKDKASKAPFGLAGEANDGRDKSKPPAPSIGPQIPVGKSDTENKSVGSEKTSSFGEKYNTSKATTQAENAKKASTDAGFKAWAVDRRGRPIEFATKAQEDESRRVFDRLVADGKVDGKTGQMIVSKSTADAGETIDVAKEEYPTIVNKKSGKRRLTGIAAQRKAAAITDEMAARELLGDAAFSKEELTRRLAQWERHPTDANAPHREAAKFLLGKMEGATKATAPAAAPTAKQNLGVDSEKERADWLKTTSAAADKHVEEFLGTMTQKQGARAKKSLGTTVNVDGKNMTMRFFLEDAKNKGLKLSVDYVEQDGEPSVVGGVRLENGSLIKLNNTQMAYAKDHLRLELNNKEIEAVGTDTIAKQAARYNELKRDKKGRPIWQNSEGDVAMRANDPKRRGRTEVVAWAKKNGRQVINGMVTPDAMREYDAQMAQKAAKAVKRLFPDMKVDYYDKAPDMGGEGKRIEMRNKHGDMLGWFEPRTKRVALLPGADAETVAHEIGWHGVRDWAQRNSPKLFAKMREVEDNVDPELRTKVLRMYRAATGYGRDTLLNEFGAWTFMGRGGKELERIVASKEGAKWYAKMLNSAKEIYKDYATKHGGNRIDLDKIDAMDRETFMDYMAQEIASGKTLGDISAQPNKAVLSTKESKVEAYKRKVYDVGAVFRELGKEIAKVSGNKKNLASDVDEAFALRPGEKEAAAIRVKGKIKELQELYAKHGVSHEDFAYYMACKAAADRDAKIDANNIAEAQDRAEAQVRAEWGEKEIKRDPEGFEDAVAIARDLAKADYTSSNGSAIDPREARKTIKEWESGDMAAKTAELQTAWRDIIEHTIDLQVEAGLVSKEQADIWRTQEPNYVPFKSPIDEVSGEYYGRGTNLAKPEHFRAEGRKTAAGDVLTHAIMDWQATESRAIENNLRIKLADLVQAHPELGTVSKLGSRKIGEQRTRSGRGEKNVADNVITFKRGGDNYVIELNGERGKSIAAAISGRNLTGEWANAGITIGGKKLTIRGLSRLWASTATELSPTFAIRNTIKDNIELGNIVFTEMGPAKGAKFAAAYAKNRIANEPAIWKYITSGKIDTSTDSGKALQSFIDDGGMIGGMGREGYGDVAKQFSAKEIDALMKQGNSKPLAFAKHAIHSVQYITRWSELATRLNAYQAAKAVGMDGKEAALWSRRAITDFNRKGEWTGVTNVARMFSNSTLGATARAFKSFGTSKWGIAAIGALLAKGYLSEMLDDEVNEDWDEQAKKTGAPSGKDISEYDRVNSFALARKGDKEYRIPQHESPFSVVSYAGGLLYRLQHGEISTEQAAREMGLEAATLAIHMTGWGDVNFDNEDKSASGIMKSASVSGVPSVLQPVMEILTNTDYAGRQVHRPEFPSETTPASERGRKQTPEMFKRLAQWLNEKSGGSEGRAGFLDAYPETLQKIFEGSGKNMTKDMITAYVTLSAMFGDATEDIPTKNVFALRDFKRDVADNTSRYFTTKRSVEADVNEYKTMHTKMTNDERKQYLATHPWVQQETRDKLNRLVNGSRKEGVRGIDDLRRLIEGKRYDGKSWVQRTTPPSQEQVEKWQAELRRKQARYLELTEAK